MRTAWRGIQPIGGVLAVAGLLSCCRAPETSKTGSAPPLAVQTVRVSEAPADGVTRFPVTIGRDREADLSLRVGGVVSSMPVRIGERLNTGQVIVRLDATPFIAARERDQAEVAKLTRLADRNEQLLPAGAVAQSARDDAIDSLSAAQASLNSASYDEASSVARAPFSGVLLSRDIEVGETVSPGQRVARIADLSSPLLARAAVARDVAARLRRGSSARVLVPGALAPFAARVRNVGALSDPRTSTVQVELLLDGAPDIASGAIGSVELTIRPGGAERLPAEALLDANDGWGHVFIVDPVRTTAQRVKIRVLAFDGDWLLVAGLSGDSKVITAGAGFVIEGQKVLVASQ